MVENTSHIKLGAPVSTQRAHDTPTTQQQQQDRVQWSRATRSYEAMGKSKGNSRKGTSPLPTSGAASAAALHGHVVAGEQPQTNIKTKTPPKSKINKKGWKFDKYNRGSSGTNCVASPLATMAVF